MNHIVIQHRPHSDPCDWIVVPVNANIFRNDQDIQWHIIDPSGTVTWGSPAIVFDTQWTLDGGSTPAPMPGPGPAPPLRATGPGPNPGKTPVVYSYTIFINVPGCSTDSVKVQFKVKVEHGHTIAIDPDVWNQPQP
jgi:hypothetical protein